MKTSKAKLLKKKIRMKKIKKSQKKKNKMNMIIFKRKLKLP